MSDSIVQAVLAPLPPRKSKGRDKVAEQRVHARRALFAAAQLARAKLDVLAQDERGAPMPSNGWYWSLSHCGSMVAACVHRAPVGIDVEDRGDVRAEVIERVLDPNEIALFERRRELGFLRAWTAKEAFLKELGLGISGLARCKVVEIASGAKLVLDIDGQRRDVWQCVRRDFVLAISTGANPPIECVELGDPMPTPERREPWS